ncbi:hypothetical protein ACRAWF_02065 [Streptomyces sp. L7]
MCTFVLLAVGGCSGSPGPARRPALPTYGTYDINAQPADALRAGGTLTLPMAQMITQFNFDHVDGALDDVWTVDSMTEPRLFARDAKGVPHAVPEYLLSASVTGTSPQVVTYRLNPKARWSDGTALGWRDFAAQWHALGGADQRYLVADTSGYDRIADVREGRRRARGAGHLQAAVRRLAQAVHPALPGRRPTTPRSVSTSGWQGQLPISAGLRSSSPRSTGPRRPSPSSPTPAGGAPNPGSTGSSSASSTPSAALQAFPERRGRRGQRGHQRGLRAAEERAGQRDPPSAPPGTRCASPSTARAARLRRPDRYATRSNGPSTAPRWPDVAAEGLPVKVPLLGNHFSS